MSSQASRGPPARTARGCAAHTCTADPDPLTQPPCQRACSPAGPLRSSISDFVAAAADVSAFAKFLGPLGDRIDGTLGLDVFDGRVVTLSVGWHSITVEDEASVRRIAAQARAVPIRLVRSAEGAALTVDIGVTTRLGMVWMEVDTGNGGPSMVDSRAAPLIGLDPAASGPQPLDALVGTETHLHGPVIVKDVVMDGNIGRRTLVAASQTGRY